MKILVASIHHTGTNFVMQSLLSAFSNHPNTVGIEPPNWSKVHVHIEPALLHTLNYWVHRLYPIVVPLRHPAAVALSWKRRGLSIDDMVVQWKMMLRHVAPFQPSFLPLDSPRREDWLRLFCEQYKLDLPTDWEVVRGSGIVITDPDAELNAIELSEIDSLLSSPFFERFYPRNDHVLRIDPETSASTRAGAPPPG